MFEGRRPLYGSFSMPPGHEHHDGRRHRRPRRRSTACRARWPARSPTAARRSSSTATRSRRCWCASTGPVQYEAELVHLQEVTGARIVQRTAVFGQVRLFAERRVDLVGRPELDRPPDRRGAADGAAPVRARPRPGRRPRACSTSPCTGCRRRASAPRSSSTSRASSGRRWTWRRSSTPRSCRSRTASTSRRCSPRCSSTTWRRS